MPITINGTTGIAGVDGSAATPAVQGTDTNTGVYFGADTVYLVEGGVEGLRLNSSGNTQLAGNLGLGATTPTTSGTGITFPAAQSASTNANTLDDYEEGTWTPNQGSGLTVTGAFSSGGWYTKLGNIVTVTGYVRGATSVSVNAVGIITSNFPFAGGDTEVLWTGSVLNWSADSGGACAISQTNTTLYSGLTITSSSRISFTLTYRTS